MPRLSQDDLTSLESLVGALERGDAVAYGEIEEEPGGRKYLTLYGDDNTFEQICPDVIWRVAEWIKSLPPPAS